MPAYRQIKQSSQTEDQQAETRAVQEIPTLPAPQDHDPDSLAQANSSRAIYFRRSILEKQMGRRVFRIRIYSFSCCKMLSKLLRGSRKGFWLK